MYTSFCTLLAPNKSLRAMCRSDMMWIARHSCSSEHEVKGSAFQPASRNRGRSSSWISRPILSHLVAMATFHLHAVANIPLHVWHTNSVQSCIAAILKEQQTDYLKPHRQYKAIALLYPSLPRVETHEKQQKQWACILSGGYLEHAPIASLILRFLPDKLPYLGTIGNENCLPVRRFSLTISQVNGQVVYSPLPHMDVLWSSQSGVSKFLCHEGDPLSLVASEFQQWTLADDKIEERILL